MQSIGIEGFYIHSFFRIAKEFEPHLPYCLELGRSFIVEEYQKKNLPLYLLWKGILAYQIQHPQYAYLIGPVSISRYYSDFSRKVLMEYAMRHLSHTEFSGLFQPRTPYDPVLNPEQQTELQELDQIPLSELDNLIDHIRPEHMEFPVLMKQYLRQNARFLGFNLDPDFNDALDGLMILEMKDVPAATITMLQREM
jgi:putative hemolysin